MSQTNKPYIRDQRSPRPTSSTTSKVMSANKARNTSIELLLRKELRSHRIINYRLHGKGLPGRPDIVFPSTKLAVFIHGCFWHRCKRCNLTIPKSNRDFWTNKFTRNEERDKRIKRKLNKMGWGTITIWEHELKKEPGKAARKVERKLHSLQ